MDGIEHISTFSSHRRSLSSFIVDLSLEHIPLSFVVGCRYVYLYYGLVDKKVIRYS